MVLPVNVGCVRKVIGHHSVSPSVTNPPALSKCVQVPDHRSAWRHVLVSGDAIVVSTQSPDKVLIGAGQYDL